MAAPTLVREYTNDRLYALRSRNNPTKALPPISSFAFADILRAADGPDLQLAIDGIAEICAKNHMSLADEYSSHLPPLGTITATSTDGVRPHLLRPGMRRALTSVPEASSGSSEGSRQTKKKRTGLFGFRRQQVEQSKTLRVIRIGSMGRTISVGGITALASPFELPNDPDGDAQNTTGNNGNDSAVALPATRPSQATSSLQRLLRQNQRATDG